MSVYVELGRVPMTYTRLYSLIKYWSKVLVSDNCLIKQCYNEMYTNCENVGHKNWTYDIKTLLSKQGFLEIWNKQEIDRTLLAII